MPTATIQLQLELERGVPMKFLRHFVPQARLPALLHEGAQMPSSASVRPPITRAASTGRVVGGVHETAPLVLLSTARQG